MIRRPAMLSLMVIAMILGSCSEDTKETANSVTAEIHRLRESTTPHEAKPIGFTAPVLEGMNLQSSWDFDAEVTWETYCEWLRDTLSEKYKMTSRTADSIRFVRVLEGDTYSVEARVESSTMPLRIRVTFLAYLS